ncbi:MAG TPA: cupin domain-containing protein [Gaiellaceae bacterium]|nr:cupin domain-containing protein [Gaiellaceae bacterium]
MSAHTDTVHLFDLGVHFLLASQSTGGSFALVEHTLPPRALGAPLHRHANEDEYSYVLEGRLGAQLGDEVVEAGPGELVRKPRGQEHTFWNAGDEPLRFLEIISPGGFERYFRELAPVLAAGDDAGVQEIAARYELEIDFSTIPALAERHGLTVGAPA